MSQNDGDGNPSVRASSSQTISLLSHLKNKEWRKMLAPEFAKPYFKELERKLSEEYRTGKEIFPPKELIFNAMTLTPITKIKVVILGQNPYHNAGQAMGLSFSVPKSVKVPMSLQNIYKELVDDPNIHGFTKPDHGCLEAWAEQGVLLLNNSLTVERRGCSSNSHAKFGWQEFTDNVIKHVSETCDHVVFILMGRFAQKKEKKEIIDESKHKIIKTFHPSPLSSRRFFGCCCFSKCNEALEEFGLGAINWSL